MRQGKNLILNIFVTKKNDPDNIVKVKLNLQSLEKYQNEKNDLTSKMDELTAKLNALSLSMQNETNDKELKKNSLQLFQNRVEETSLHCDKLAKSLQNLEKIINRTKNEFESIEVYISTIQRFYKELSFDFGNSKDLIEELNQIFDRIKGDMNVCYDEKIPEEYTDPVSLVIMVDPFITNCCKKTFDYSTLTKIIKKTGKCCYCDKPLSENMIQHNLSMKNSIDGFKKQHKNVRELFAVESLSIVTPNIDKLEKDEVDSFKMQKEAIHLLDENINLRKKELILLMDERNEKVKKLNSYLAEKQK